MDLIKSATCSGLFKKLLKSVLRSLPEKIFKVGTGFNVVFWVQKTETNEGSDRCNLLRLLGYRELGWMRTNLAL